MTNEKLMIVHTVVFSFLTFMSFVRTTVNYFIALYSDEGDLQRLCTALKVYIPVKTLSMLASIITLILFIYMTGEFSRPMDEYWRKYLLYC